MTIKDIIQKYYDVVDSQLLRFVLVGGLNTAFGVGVYCLAIFILLFPQLIQISHYARALTAKTQRELVLITDLTTSQVVLL